MSALNKPGRGTLEALAKLANTSEGQELIDYLEQARARMLEDLVHQVDEADVRQTQGAAQAIGEIIGHIRNASTRIRG